MRDCAWKESSEIHGQAWSNVLPVSRFKVGLTPLAVYAAVRITIPQGVDNCSSLARAEADNAGLAHTEPCPTLKLG